ncbi:MobQ family relaxase, partial [Paracoccus aestuariivivens]
MASYHLSVKTIKRSAGRSATAAAAYRSGSVIACDREGRVHDYSAKQGVEACFILAPEGAPDWVQDRAALWNAAEARETRKNSVTAREWELALPAELDTEDRAVLVREFGAALVKRYGIAVDVALHAPHREGDQRNHHAHVLTTTRAIGAGGFGDKTRVLDAAKTGGSEIEAMRALWAGMQNRALERAGEQVRVDHRSLEVQREAAQARGDALAAEELGRAPEVKLGPAVNAMERRAMREAERDGVLYAPVTERGRAVQAVRQARAAWQQMRERVEQAREAYDQARDSGNGRVSAGLAALRAAAARERGAETGQGHEVGPDPASDLKARLAAILQRDRDGQEPEGGTEPETEIAGKLAGVLGRGPEPDGRDVPQPAQEAT